MKRSKWLLAVMVAALGAVGACNDENDDAGAGSDAGSGSGAGGDGQGGEPGSGGAGGEACEPVDACQECGAMSCPDERAACCSTPGCPTIIACAREHDCNGTDCYTPETCQSVIDENGGPLGDAVAAAAPLGECAAMSCPECPQPPGP